MGFELNLVISSPVSPDARGALYAAAFARWPSARGPRDSTAYPDRVVFAPPELTDYLFKTSAERNEAHSRNYDVERNLPEWSRVYPEVTFAFIKADCFGGDCEYRGFCCRDGQVFKSGDSLVGLAAGVGIAINGSLPPLVRGFFAGRGSGGFD